MPRELTFIYFMPVSDQNVFFLHLLSSRLNQKKEINHDTFLMHFDSSALNFRNVADILFWTLS